jgi:hypothetical protein
MQDVILQDTGQAQLIPLLFLRVLRNRLFTGDPSVCTAYLRPRISFPALRLKLGDGSSKGSSGEKAVWWLGG